MCSNSRGRKTTFSSFSSSYRHIHTHEAVFSLPSCCFIYLPWLLLLSLSRSSLSGAWVYIQMPFLLVDLCSWNFIRIIYNTEWVRERGKKHKNLWKRWQHHPIFCVYGTFLPPHFFFTHSYSLCVDFLQPLVCLSQPDFSEALKNTLNIFWSFTLSLSLSLLLMRVCFS